MSSLQLMPTLPQNPVKIPNSFQYNRPEGNAAASFNDCEVVKISPSNGSSFSGSNGRLIFDIKSPDTYTALDEIFLSYTIVTPTASKLVTQGGSAVFRRNILTCAGKVLEDINFYNTYVAAENSLVSEEQKHHLAIVEKMTFPVSGTPSNVNLIDGQGGAKTSTRCHHALRFGLFEKNISFPTPLVGGLTFESYLESELAKVFSDQGGQTLPANYILEDVTLTATFVRPNNEYSEKIISNLKANSLLSIPMQTVSGQHFALNAGASDQIIEVTTGALKSISGLLIVPYKTAYKDNFQPNGIKSVSLTVGTKTIPSGKAWDVEDDEAYMSSVLKRDLTSVKGAPNFYDYKGWSSTTPSMSSQKFTIRQVFSQDLGSFGDGLSTVGDNRIRINLSGTPSRGGGATSTFEAGGVYVFFVSDVMLYIGKNSLNMTSLQF